MTPTRTPVRPGRPSNAVEEARDAPLSILLIHNKYQLPGGEDGVFEREGAMLEAAGHRVFRYVLHNDEVERLGAVELAARTLWSRPAYAHVKTLVERERVDLVHVHNTLPLVSPAVFHAAHAGGAATVHSLHNYRMVCPGGLLLREGTICRDCVGKAFAAPAVRHRCYRDSVAATAAVATTVATHRALGTWDRAVDRYIVLSAFARDLFAAGGLPADRMAVKPNASSNDPGLGPGGDDVLFAGRLSDEKGVELMLRTWAEDPTLPALRIAGDGPLAPLVEAAAQADARIRWEGWTSGEDLDRLMAEAAVVLVPSTCYDGWPLVVVEAMGHGTPVIATDHGPFPEMIEDGVSGRLFARGDVTALARAVHEMTRREDREAVRVRTRRRFLERYTQDVNYGQLRAIYADALAQFAAA